MNRQDRIRANFETIETYISEHGKTMGTVSWQMAFQAIGMLKSDIGENVKELQIELQDKKHLLFLLKELENMVKENKNETNHDN